MNNLLFACAGFLTAASAWFSYRHRAGIDPVTGLAENMKWNRAAILLVLLSLSILLILALLRLPCDKQAKNKKLSKNRGAEENKNPVFAAAFLNKAIPGYAVAFYAASYLLLLMSVVFLLLLTVTAFRPMHLVLLILSIGTAAAFWRAAVIYIRRCTAPSDAFILPIPMLFLAVYALYVYTNIMAKPEVSTYYLDILAIAAILLSIYGFLSHYFGHPATCWRLFTSFSAASLGTVAYFSRAILFFTETVLPSYGDGSLFRFLAELMLFAAFSIFNVSYSIMLWNAGNKQ